MNLESTDFCNKEMNEMFRCLAWSPAGCCKLKSSCLFIAITTKFHVSIYGSISNPVSNEWKEIENLSPKIISCYTDKDVKDIADEVIINQLQSISVSWSPLCITENYDSFSIIAVGSKGGSVTLWKFKEDENSDDYLSYLDTLDSVHKSWVTITSWSKWISCDENKYASSLITGSDDGSVYLWRVMIDKSKSPIKKEDEEISIILKVELFNSDNRIPSIIKWCNNYNNGEEKLAIAKGLKIYVWTSSSKSLLISIDQGMPMVYMVSLSKMFTGLIWSHDGSKLHIFTMDGNNWTLEVTKNNGLKIDDELTNCINEVLVNIIEEQELKDEEEERCEDNDEDVFIDDNMDDEVEMNSIDNDDDDWLEKEPIFLGVDGSCNGIFAVIVFWLERADMQYRTNNSEISHLIFCPTILYNNEETHDSLISRIKELISDKYFNSLLEKLIAICKQSYNNNLYLNNYGNEDDEELTNIESLYLIKSINLNEITRQLRDRLYANGLINSFRIIIYLLLNVVNLGISDKKKAHFGVIITDYLKKIENHYLKNVLLLIVNCMKSGLTINEADIKFTLRLCDLSLLCHSEDKNLLKITKFAYEYLDSLKSQNYGIFESLENEISLVTNLISSNSKKAGSFEKILAISN
ncbi:5242_t:CDS:10 [Entrophospora sp. SA101]|nr:5242_t:CDS:10 [Entrophospora sp. SA101]CAJ0833522.1 17605_t:CDS:10 [Entrophospora sp. SA101]CAJ0901763.1 14321_t:CDS:10 [Entrophospora sp. SA101]